MYLVPVFGTVVPFFVPSFRLVGVRRSVCWYPRTSFWGPGNICQNHPSINHPVLRTPTWEHRSSSHAERAGVQPNDHKNSRRLQRCLSQKEPSWEVTGSTVGGSVDPKFGTGLPVSLSVQHTDRITKPRKKARNQETSRLTCLKDCLMKVSRSSFKGGSRKGGLIERQEVASKMPNSSLKTLFRCPFQIAVFTLPIFDPETAWCAGDLPLERMGSKASSFPRDPGMTNSLAGIS